MYILGDHRPHKDPPFSHSYSPLPNILINALIILMPCCFKCCNRAWSSIQFAKTKIEKKMFRWNAECLNNLSLLAQTVYHLNAQHVLKDCSYQRGCKLKKSSFFPFSFFSTIEYIMWSLESCDLLKKLSVGDINFVSSSVLWFGITFTCTCVFHPFFKLSQFFCIFETTTLSLIRFSKADQLLFKGGVEEEAVNTYNLWQQFTDV